MFETVDSMPMSCIRLEIASRKGYTPLLYYIEAKRLRLHLIRRGTHRSLLQREIVPALEVLLQMKSLLVVLLLLIFHAFQRILQD